MLVAYLFFLFFSLRFPHSHGHTTYPRRRSSSASWWRPTSSQTWPTVSEFTPTYSLLLRFPKDYKTGSWETDRKEPLDSGWPEHCRGFHIKGDLFFFFKDTGGFLWRDAHMCLQNQRFQLIEAGDGGSWGGLIKRRSEESSSAPRINAYPPPHRPVDIHMSGFRWTCWPTWWRDIKE